jgi:hypothetical protein
MNRAWLYGALLSLLSLLCGCSQSQKNFANNLKAADRIVVTNTFEALSITVTGTDVGAIVQAIANGKKESPNIDAAMGYKLEIFEGSNHLATVNTSGSVFWIGKTPYSDPTERISSLYRRLREETDLKKP